MTRQTLHFDYAQRARSRTLRHAQGDALGLLRLRRVLLTAGRGAPSRIPSWNPDERLALQLIEKMKATPALATPFAGLAVESPQPLSRAAVQEMAESHA
ncbi:MAG TPA: hypothetical protein PLA27_00625 [Anaerolineales bacterium]|jgi:hypothetical protein|nr:hypothetical protein [Anaerolineales bacterium]